MSDEVPRSIDAVVIRAGQAGLIMSWHLQHAGRDHVVLDRRETLGGGWQDRWDDFTLVGPNWTTGLPFIGLLWQLNNASANLTGVPVDAEYLASRW